MLSGEEAKSRTSKCIRILSFNVNGLRACLKRLYGPLATIKNILDDVGRNVDILCLQETKLRREELVSSPQLAIADGWESFFACSTGQRGYSGVATFVRSKVCLPFSAEIGFTGMFSSKLCGEIPSHSRHSGEELQSCIHSELISEFTLEELQDLDSEGRVVITDHGAFILYNIYGPALTSDDPKQLATRMEYKMKFYKALEMRWRRHTCSGRAVIVVGDFNIAPAPIDYPDIDLDFYSKERMDRIWLRNLLTLEDKDNSLPHFTDCFRVFHPQRRNAFTVWSTATNARALNYGSRIDLCLSSGIHFINKLDTNEAFGFDGKEIQECSRNSSSCICYGYGSSDLNDGSRKESRYSGICIGDCNISPEQEGSDHCPVWMDVLYQCCFPCSSAIPKCAARFAFGGGKQTKLHQWLPCSNNLQERNAIKTKKDDAQNEYNSLCLLQDSEEEPGIDSSTEGRHKEKDTNMKATATKSIHGQTKYTSKGTLLNQQFQRQPDIKSFFKSETDIKGKECYHTQTKDLTSVSGNHASEMGEGNKTVGAAVEAEWIIKEKAAVEAHQRQLQQEARDAWMGIRQKMVIPKCKHGEQAALKQVGKAGPNKGKWFYTCARPAGKGIEGQCGFFKWVKPSKSRASSSSETRMSSEDNARENKKLRI